MAERVVSVRLQANVQGFTAGMQKAKASVDDLTKAAAPSKADAFGKMADKAALAGLGVAAAVGVAVTKFADFDQAMSAVKANSGAAGKSLDDLRQAAITMGADSQFSATEAAQGINEMAKAGVATADILGGGLKGALDLAAAGQISVADAAETAATAMSIFKLSGSQIPHVADLLANASNKAQGGVGDMAAALKQAGLVAAGMGLSIEETTAGLTAFAKAGLLGSDAGTSFKTMLQRFAAPAGEAAALMDKMNISAYDSQGNFVGLANVAGQLTEAFKDKSLAERNAAFATIFGSDAVRAANVLYNEGADGINRWTKEVSESGAASKQAAALTDNLKGDLERLGGALDSVFIQTGSGANGSLRGLTQGLTGLIDRVGQIPGPLLLAGGALSAFALLAPRGVVAYRNYKTQLDTLGVSLEKITAKAPRTGAALEKVGKGAKIAGGAFVAMSVASQIAGDEMQKFGPEGLTKDLLNAADAADALNKRIAEGSIFDGTFDSSIKNIGDALRTSFDPSTGQSIDDTLGGIAAGFGLIGENESDVAIATQRLGELDSALSGLVASGNSDRAATAFDQIAANAAAAGFTTAQLRDKLPQYGEALASVSNQATLAADGQNVMTEATDGVKDSADNAKDALDNLRSAIEGLGSPLAAQRAAERDYQQAIDDSADRLKKRAELQKQLAEAKTKPAGTKDEQKARADEIKRITDELALYTKGFDLNTEAGRNNQAALDAIREKTLAKVQADFDAVNASKGTTAATAAATDAMKKGRDAFIKAAEAAGATKDEAKKLADNLGLVPKDVSIIVKQSGAAEAQDAIDAAARDRVALITVKTRIADLKAKQASDAGAVPEWAGATGGAVFGRGTATSDSIHALLSNGEHVWTAAEVKALGGQGAMYALRAAVRAGNAPRFANGGAVAASPTLAPSLMVARSSDGMGRMSIAGQVDLGNGLTGFVRGIVQNALEDHARNTNLRRVG